MKDVWSNRIVGYSIDDRMTAELACSALRNAIGLRSPAGTIVHSDRGSQFRSRKYVNLLSRNGLHGSMGRIAACADNSAMESWFALLQRNVLDRKRWDTTGELRLAMVQWIERTYHRRRRQRGLSRLTPVEYETLNKASLAASNHHNPRVNQIRDSPNRRRWITPGLLETVGSGEDQRHGGATKVPGGAA